VASILAFFAVYAYQGEKLAWSTFFSARFDRGLYLRNHFILGFSFTPQLGVAVAAGVGFCLICAFVQAPFFRAIAGSRYPVAPRSLREVLRLFLYYLLFYLVAEIGALAIPPTRGLDELVELVLLAVLVVLAFADYVIVFEDVGVIRGIRRSLRLVRVRPALVSLVVVGLSLLDTVIAWLYSLDYHSDKAIFFLLPVSQILVETLIALFANILLVFLYEDLRRQSPAKAEV